MRKNVWIDAYKHYFRGLIAVVLFCITCSLYVFYTLVTMPSIALGVLYSNWWVGVMVIVLLPLGFWAIYNQLKKEKGTEFKITTLKEIKGKKMDFKTFEEKVVATIESILRDCGLDFEKTREKKGGLIMTSFAIPIYSFRIEPRFSLAGMYQKEVDILIGPKTLDNKEVVKKV
ncbi:MAG: hypothetical protein KJ655_02430, partial [Candidatus Thermoplasmatota archaeon]|nr:hypothetical protein [Candidatus Thermoplasmatota archaeon]